MSSIELGGSSTVIETSGAGIMAEGSEIPHTIHRTLGSTVVYFHQMHDTVPAPYLPEPFVLPQKR